MSRVGALIHPLIILSIATTTIWAADRAPSPTGCLACGHADRARLAAKQDEPGQRVADSRPSDTNIRPVISRRLNAVTSVSALAAEDCCDPPIDSSDDCYSPAYAECDHCHRRHIVEETGWFNCGCSGSYKFPVPPQYTYHWPGIYSQQLMTDYVSPWRFPPLKPYTDEPAPITAARQPATVRATSALKSANPTPKAYSPHDRSNRIGATSDKLQQHYGIR